MLSDKIKEYKVEKIKKEWIEKYGDEKDGVIEFIGLVDKGEIEVGYYYGETKKKNIIAVSQQVGCPAQCSFCELGDQKFVGSLSGREIYEQVVLMLQQVKTYNIDIDQAKHKVNFSKSGDPLFNPNFREALERIAEFNFSYKVSTVFPDSDHSLRRFSEIADFAREYDPPVQIQISLISTDEKFRNEQAGIKLASFEKIREVGEEWMIKNPERKINLSLILTESNPIDVEEV